MTLLPQAIYRFSAAAAKSLQSCPTLCDPIDSSPPGSAVPEILQARTLEWVAISFSNAWKWKVKVKLLSHVWFICPNLCDPVDCSLPGSSVRGIFQAILEWVAIAFSKIQCNPYQITNGIFHTTRTKKKSVNLYGNTKKTLNGQSNSEKEETELEESGSLTSDYTTKPQSSKQYGTGTETET